MQPAIHTLPLVPVHQILAVLRDNLNGSRQIVARLGEMQRLIQVAVVRIPGTGAQLQGCHLGRTVLLFQSITQELPEQLMAAIPVSLIIHRGQEKIGSLQPFQNRQVIVCEINHARHGFAQWAAQLIEDGTLDQEFLYGNWQLRQHLGHQIVHDIQVIAQTVWREQGQRLLLTQGQGGQTQAGGPAFGPSRYGRDGLLIQRQCHGLGQELPGFLRREAQIASA